MATFALSANEGVARETLFVAKLSITDMSLFTEDDTWVIYYRVFQPYVSVADSFSKSFKDADKYDSAFEFKAPFVNQDTKFVVNVKIVANGVEYFAEDSLLVHPAAATVDIATDGALKKITDLSKAPAGAASSTVTLTDIADSANLLKTLFDNKRGTTSDESDTTEPSVDNTTSKFS